MSDLTPPLSTSLRNSPSRSDEYPAASANRFSAPGRLSPSCCFNSSMLTVPLLAIWVMAKNTRFILSLERPSATPAVVKPVNTRVISSSSYLPLGSEATNCENSSPDPKKLTFSRSDSARTNSMACATFWASPSNAASNRSLMVSSRLAALNTWPTCRAIP